MAFIAIDARADVVGSKKGKLTPAQHAQLNAWCLASKTGILDWGSRCSTTANTYSVSGGVARVFFHSGFVVICGRLVECEENSYVDVGAPAVGTASGKIILRFALSNTGNEEFSVDTTTDSLVQQDLNDNTNGTYEFELCQYTANDQTVMITSQNTNYVPDIGGKLEQFITVITGSGMSGTGTPPLQGYNRSKGTIEYRLSPLDSYNTSKGTIEQRLTNLGFRQGGISNVSGMAISNATLRRQGNYVIGQFTFLYSNPYVTSFRFILPEYFRPYSSISTTVGVRYQENGVSRSASGIMYIGTNGVVECNLSDTAVGSSFGSGSSTVHFGFEAPPII